MGFKDINPQFSVYYLNIPRHAKINYFLLALKYSNASNSSNMESAGLFWKVAGVSDTE